MDERARTRARTHARITPRHQHPPHARTHQEVPRRTVDQDVEAAPSQAGRARRPGRRVRRSADVPLEGGDGRHAGGPQVGHRRVQDGLAAAGDADGCAVEACVWWVRK